MAMDDKVLKKVKKISDKKDADKQLANLEAGLEASRMASRMGKNFQNMSEVLSSIEKDLNDPKISEAEKKDLREKKKEFKKRENIGEPMSAFKSGKKTDFGMLSVKKGIDKNPKPTQADRIAGATKKGLKSGDSTFLERRKKLAGLKDAAKATVKAKDGSRTKVRGVRIANKGFRKARMS